MITENELFEILKANKEIKEWYDCFYDNHSINDYYESELWVIAKAIIDKIKAEEFNIYIVNSKVKDMGNGIKERTIRIKKG